MDSMLPLLGMEREEAEPTDPTEERRLAALLCPCRCPCPARVEDEDSPGDDVIAREALLRGGAAPLSVACQLEACWRPAAMDDRLCCAILVRDKLLLLPAEGMGIRVEELLKLGIT
jgi:hypothetical protein